jgi:hypothetical protein
MTPILHSFAYSLEYLRELLADIPDSDMTAQSTGLANHPSWTVGHLTFILQMIGHVIGVPPWLTEAFAKRYGPGSVPATDADSYESKHVALAMLADAQSRITNAVLALDPSRLDDHFPDPNFLDVFPTIRHALTQVLLGHTAYHIGQLAVWRRAMGLPAMKRSYE